MALRIYRAEDLPEETAEGAYRRGYCDGWVAAFQAMEQCPNGVGRFQLLHFMWHYWGHALQDWSQRSQDNPGFEEPPRFTIPASFHRRPFTAGERGRVMQNHDYTCFWCGHRAYGPLGPDGRTWTIDHRTPLARGGSNEVDNLVLACATCNSKKGADLW